MQLSVVIVSYNVRYFLEQCLLSVARASSGLEVETWVVDNNSFDGSVEMVRERFPWVHLIANDHNPGFSVANNQAIRQSKGEYVLLLNPDTVVREDTFRRCLNFSAGHPELGGLGVKMIDGSGRFLPESKRGLPTPWVAFTKAFGLARLFPKSPRFGRYHLGYLDERQTHEIEVLAGAFMWMRRSCLDQVGLLDENFFMYGEDIDLSYRITQGGYKNYYFPATSIIHYKGESTKRGSLNYVKVFYQAMIIFAEKHFVGTQARLLVTFMRLAVYLRALLTVLGSGWRSLRFPLLDAVGIYAGLLLLKRLWSDYHFGDPDYFPDYIDYLHFPAYTLLWTGGLFLGGGYDRPFDVGRLLRALGLTTMLIFAIYGLLPESLRPSRALLLLGATWAVAWLLLVRSIFHLLRHGDLKFSGRETRRSLVVGSAGETERTLSLLQQVGAVRHYLGRIQPEASPAAPPSRYAAAIGDTSQLERLVDLYGVEELIFCSADLSIMAITDWMSTLGPELHYHILPEASNSIIGSQRSDRKGRLYTIDINLRLADPVNRRAKWVFDRAIALVLLLLWPVLVFVVEHKRGLMANIWRVMLGQRTWVGYHPEDPQQADLPSMQRGVIYPGIAMEMQDERVLHHLNLLYARDYRVGIDWRLLRKHLTHLGD